MDGFGIQLLRKGGIQTAIITNRKSRTNSRRAKELHIPHVYQDASDKLSVFVDVLRKLRVAPEEACCIGDDLVDIPLLSRCGFAVAVQNAVPEVKRVAHYVTAKSGGRGAIREVADKVLKVQGKWTHVAEKYFS